MKTYCYPILLVLCLILGTVKIYAQEQIDNSSRIMYATSMHNLGLKHLSNNKLQLALEYTKKAVDYRLELLGENNKDYIKSLHNLAVCYSQLNKYNEALNTELKVSKLINETDLCNDTINAIANISLGNHFYNIGSIEEAIKIGEEACNITKRILGDENIEYANSLNLLGNYKTAKGLYQEAIDIENKALAIYTTKKYNLGIAASLMQIGIVYSNQQQYTMAIKYLESSAKIYESNINYRHYYMNQAVQDFWTAFLL